MNKCLSTLIFTISFLVKDSRHCFFCIYQSIYNFKHTSQNRQIRELHQSVEDAELRAKAAENALHEVQEQVIELV